jgi:hypothetical protein
MPHGGELAGPVLGTTTGFHADQAGWLVNEVFPELVAHELHLKNLSSVSIHPVQLKYALGDVDTNHSFATIHFGLSCCRGRFRIFHPLGTQMP